MGVGRIFSRGESNSGKISFCHFETKIKTFFQQKVNRKISNFKIQRVPRFMSSYSDAHAHCATLHTWDSPSWPGSSRSFAAYKDRMKPRARSWFRCATRKQRLDRCPELANCAQLRRKPARLQICEKRRISEAISRQPTSSGCNVAPGSKVTTMSRYFE